MPSIPTQTRGQFVSNAVTAAQAANDSNLTFQTGSTELALVEGDIANWLWLQAQITVVASAIRLATSKGNDVDTFIADFGLKRLPAVAASGNLTFSRFTNTSQAVVPIGAIAQTSSVIQFTVTLDATNPNYNSSLNGYVIAPGVSSVSVPAQALVAGSAGNVTANTITVIASVIVGVDTVNNTSDFSGGEDIETDDAVKKRFVLFLASLSRATEEALEYALSIVQDGLKYKLIENKDYGTGNTLLGQFYAVISDGNTTANNNLLQNALANLNRYRAFAVAASDYWATTIPVDIVATITVVSGSDSTSIITQANTNVTNYIKALNIGDTLFYNRIAGLIYDAGIDPDTLANNILSVDTLTVNGAASNITADDKHLIILNSLSITLTP